MTELGDFRLSRQAKRLFLASWLLVVLAGYLALMAILVNERARDLRQWEVRLSYTSGVQARAITSWVRDRFAALETLASNVSLRLYLTEYTQERESGLPGEEPPPLTYLRNLIVASASAGGFVSGSDDAAGQVSASIRTEPAGGLLLADAQGRLVASTRRMPPAEELAPELMDFEHGRNPVFSGPFRLRSGMIVAGFRLPVYAVQADAALAEPIGYVFGVTPLGASFHELFKEVFPQENSLETVLVTKQQSQVVYFSALQDGKQPMELSLDLDSPLASVQAYRSPGMLIDAPDYRNRETLAFGRLIEQTPWMLVRKIDRAVALTETATRANWFQVSYFLSVALITAAVLALWRHATTLRARAAAAYYRALMLKIERQERLLELIEEHTPVATYIADREHRLCYANREAAREAGLEPRDMKGKTLEAAFGQVRAKPLIAASDKASVTGREQDSRWQEDDEGRIIRATRAKHIPLAHIPLVDSEEETSGVLVVEENVSDVLREEERLRKTLARLVEALVSIVDRRDPHAAHHSACVALTARAVAKQMGLSASGVDTAETAGRLMNVGKILVPEDILTSREALGPDARERIREAILASANLLDGIAFDGPVAQTIRQSLEQVDGSGPMGLRGDAILMTARIIGAVNHFVAMISPRAYRERVSFDDAVKAMLEGIGRQYDRAVVAALVHYLENNGGREALDAMLSGMRGT